MNRLLIAGAGADSGFGLPSGNSFIRDTFYRRKDDLYRALSDFYTAYPRLDGQKNASSNVPSEYRYAFLFDWKSIAFRLLLENIAADHPGLLEQILGTSVNENAINELAADQLKQLYVSIMQTSVKPEFESGILGSLPDSVHFGILEGYYSELLQPNRHGVRFWKLVNFYWSSFFTIALPIFNKLYQNIDKYQNNCFDYILTNINQSIKDLSICHHHNSWHNNNYYKLLDGIINNVITTNYTGFASMAVGGDCEKVSWLAGKLSTFESLPSLDVCDYSQKDMIIGDDEFVFPYMMCQSPVKPVVGPAQIREYGKALSYLAEAEEIIVLGYSFCNEDTHIASMVREALCGNNKKKLIYFKHGTNSDRDAEKLNLIRRLRLPLDICDDTIEIRLVDDCNSKEFVDYCNNIV